MTRLQPSVSILPQTGQDTRLETAPIAPIAPMRSSIFFSAEAQNNFKGKDDSPPNHALFAQCKERPEIFARNGYWAVPR